MQFTRETYHIIEKACTDKTDINFEVKVEISIFSNSENKIPMEWTQYQPPCLPQKDYAQIIGYSKGDEKDSLSEIELIVNLGGGKIYYKCGLKPNTVAMKIVWGSNIDII